MKQRLFIADFSNLLIRHAANPYGNITDSLGRSIQGPYGSINQILRNITENTPPTHMLIAKDTGRDDSIRGKISSDYKAHRPQAEDDLKRQFKLAYQIIDLLKWPIISVPGYEADDVMASAARIFQGRTQIITGDKDLLALTSNPQVRIMLLRPGAMMYCSKEECYKLYGVWPEQVRDYKALVGDKSDGISGIPGIGPKTACKLLEEHKTLANIYKQIETLEINQTISGISKSMHKKIVEGRQQARTSWKLAGLHNTLEINTENLLLPEKPNPEKLYEKFKELDVLPIWEIIKEKYQ